jgi:flagellar assembly protein FliH
MSSSSSTSVRRVLRAADVAAAATTPVDVLGIDLRPEGLRRLDPQRVDRAVAEGRAAGYEAGLAAGLAEGRAAAAEQAAVERAATRTRVQRLLESTEAALVDGERRQQAALDALADRAAELAFAIAEAVVGRELTTAIDPGRDAVARALAVVEPGDDEIVVHLNPADVEALATDSLPGGRRVVVEADEAIAPGDCVARVGASTIDARMATALARVRAVLTGSTS